MNPKYDDRTEACLNDIVVVHRQDLVKYSDHNGSWTEIEDRGNVLAKVVDFHPDNKKCFELMYLKDNNRKTFRTDRCKLADYRDLNNAN